MDILYIEMKLLMMMNKMHIFTPRLRLISLDFWVDTLLSKLCNLYFVKIFPRFFIEEFPSD